MTRETSQIPALLFDLDGTLIDSVYQHVLAWHEALEELGLSLAVWRIHRRIGMSGGLLVQALGREIGHYHAEARRIRRSGSLTCSYGRGRQRGALSVGDRQADQDGRLSSWHESCCYVAQYLGSCTQPGEGKDD
jgi:hypothetical protein